MLFSIARRRLGAAATYEGYGPMGGHGGKKSIAAKSVGLVKGKFFARPAVGGKNIDQMVRATQHARPFNKTEWYEGDGRGPMAGPGWNGGLGPNLERCTSTPARAVQDSVDTRGPVYHFVASMEKRFAAFMSQEDGFIPQFKTDMMNVPFHLKKEASGQKPEDVALMQELAHEAEAKEEESLEDAAKKAK